MTLTTDQPTCDALHSPSQIAHPDWSPPFDSDLAASRATRHTLLDDIADGQTLLIGADFAGPTVGHVVRDGDGYRLEN